MTIDPRLAERRRRVAEHKARSSLRRVGVVLVVVAMAAATAWVLRSSWFSISTIEVAGVAASSVETRLDEAGVRVKGFLVEGSDTGHISVVLWRPP